ncbi:nucleotidyltransferase family protein [Sedimenticola selenatireducens]|uniref:nucleotidyltransferase domain-containing protein n=1 Tax=Sedimenticola selenatireducens TaxID=191960 RepID=UPI00048D2044|nr:nucleotidyltransferase family protein [Sedimenticola selenatireducens]
MSQNSRELSLLLCLCRTEPAEHARNLLQEAPDDFDWGFLVQTAYAHGVTGLLCNSLINMPKTLIPEVILEASQEHLRQHRASNQILVDQLTHILTELAATDIEAIPFKGPTLAISAYGDLALRTFRDLDFLIHKTKIQPCLDKMEEIGYTQNMHLSPRQMQAFLGYSGQDVLYGEGIPVEPHWTFAPHTFALDIDYAGLWDRTQKITFNGQHIRNLAPEDELIILCIHGSKEKWTKLKWVADVAEFTRSHPELDWKQLFVLAESQGLARMVKLGLKLAELLLEAQIPPVVANWLAKDRMALDWSNQLAGEFFDVDKRARSIYELSRFHWEIRERRRDQWRYLYRTLIQPREQHFIGITFPDRLFFLYTLYKLLHDYLALPIWLQIKRHRGGQSITGPAETEHTDATR